MHSGVDRENESKDFSSSVRIVPLSTMRERQMSLSRVEPRNISSLGREIFRFFFDKMFHLYRKNVLCGSHCGSVEEGAVMRILKKINEEIRIIRERDPAIHSNMEVLLYPSFKVMLHYRLAHKLYRKGHYFWARWVSQRGVRKTGIEIHPGAQIGKGFFIDHGNGVIIGETTIIGDNVTLYQGVTLGGTGKEQGKRHPTIGNNVMISAGAKVLGSFTIGDNSKIGAGSVVLEEVPPNSTVVGVPGRVVKRNHISLPQEELDQVHLPDPVKEELVSLRNRMMQLEEELDHIKKENSHGK